MRAKDFKADDAQKEKVASKGRVEAEYTELRAHAVAYCEQKKKQEKQGEKDLANAKKQAVRTVAQVMCLSAVLQKGHSLPGEDGELVAQGAEHFSQCLAKFMNKDGGPYDWQEELDAMTAKWNKLVLGHKEAIPGSEVSFKDLRDKLPDMLKESSLPAEITGVKVEEEKEEEPEPAAEQSEEEVPEDVADAAVDFAAGFDVFDSDSDDAGPPPKKEEPPAPVKDEEEKVEEVPEAGGTEPVGETAGDGGEDAPADGERGRGGRGRGNKNWRKRGRGGDGPDGEGGEGHRGDRGERGDRGWRGRGDRRPRTAKPANQDDEGFEVVGNKD